MKKAVSMRNHHHHFHHEESERREWQNPEAILSEIGLKPGQTFADIGCGDGFFAIPAARIVGKTGSVIGIDIDADALRELKEKARKEHLTNITLILSEAEKSIPCEKCADIVLFGIDLHDFLDPIKVLANARKIIRPSGRLVDIDWRKEPMEVGPPIGIRFDEKKAAGLIEKAGFKIERIGLSGQYHYLIIAVPM